MALDPTVHHFATEPNFAAFTTLFEDGHPQTHLMWVDADDEHVLINTEKGRAKFRNVQRDPRVTVTIFDRDDPYRYVEVRGRVTEMVGGADAHAQLEACSQRYLGRPYPNPIQGERVILRITPERIHRNGV